MKNPIVVKVLSIAGTLLVLFPIGFMLLTTLSRLFSGNGFGMDYLLPAEFGLFVIGGAVLLLMGTWFSKPDRNRILLGITVALATFVLSSLVAAVSGLADGTIGEDSWPFYVVVCFFIVYDLSVVWMGVAGILYVLRLFRQKNA